MLGPCCRCQGWVSKFLVVPVCGCKELEINPWLMELY